MTQAATTAIKNIDPTQLIVFIVLLFLSGFFSSAETSLTSISKIRLRNMVDEKAKNAELVQKVLEDPAKLLTAILIGNNLVNIGASALSTVIATNLFGSKGVGIATGITTIAVLIFGEITPKTYAKENCEKVAAFCAGPIALCMFVCTPFIFILDIITSGIFKLLGMDADKALPAVTESEFLTMVTVSHEEGVLETPEREMITNVVDFGNTKAEAVMIPRTEMAALPVDASFKEVITMFREKQYTRLPVYNETLDNIIGVLSFKDIMLLEDTDDFKIEDYMHEPYFTYESKPCSQLFSIMRTNSVRMAIVLDEYGGTAGLLTLQDMIEEIVGDILEDNEDEQEEIVPVSENEFMVEAVTRLDDVNDMLGTDLKSEDVETIGGYVLGLLGRFPEAGETVEDNGLIFDIEEAEKNRIVMLRITKKPNDEAEEKVKQ
ncbi:MAG: HlyC/CorC family transporter [Firmicutes bacterium]|nr:HlyC/CorC family transporter [Bacillota bacterium]